MSNRCLIRHGLFFLFWLWLAAGGFCQAGFAASFTMSLDRNKMSVDDRATLTMRFEGGHPESVPDLPSILNLTTQYVGQGSSTVNNNGQTTSSITVTFSVLASQPGKYVIPAISAPIDGQTYSSQPLTLEVERSLPQTFALLQMYVNKKNVYIGEVVPVRVQFLYQYLQSQQIPLPHFKEEGFTLGKIVLNSQSTTTLDGQQYRVAVLDTTVTPVKVGTLELGPATMDLAIPRSQPRQSFFGAQVDWKEATIESEPKTLLVMPLPQTNIPPGFNGAVGAFNMNVSANPTNIAIGDPLTVKVQIVGRGALEALTLPPQTGWDKFKLYPPTSTIENTDQLGIFGTKNFSLTAVPENLDLTELPPFRFSFFDPDQRSYRTLTNGPIPLTVRPSAASLPPPMAGSSNSGDADVSTNQQSLTPIKQRLGEIVTARLPLVMQTSFLLFNAIPVLGFIAVFINRKRAENLSNNPRLRRQREVEKALRNGLAELRKAAAENDGPRFFAIVTDLLQKQLGERLDLPASAITEAVVEQRLRPLDMPEAELQSVHELFQSCNQALYAPKSSHAELMSVIGRLEETLANLKKLKG